MEPSGRLVVIGAGDVGGEVARRWVAGGGEAVGIPASTARHDALAAAGVEPRIGDPAQILREACRLHGLPEPALGDALASGRAAPPGSPTLPGLPQGTTCRCYAVTFSENGPIPTCQRPWRADLA